MEVELTILKSPLESADDLAAKDFAQDFLGRELVFSCVDPTGVIGREAARGNDTMNVRVNHPRSQYPERRKHVRPSLLPIPSS